MRKSNAVIVLATAALLLGVGTLARAVEVDVTAKVTYAAPTTRADGTPLPAGELKELRLKWGTSSGSHPNVITLPPASGTYNWATTLNIPVGGVTTVYYVMTAVNTNADPTKAESVASAEVKKSFALLSDAAPSAPTITIGTFTCTAPSGYRCTVLP